MRYWDYRLKPSQETELTKLLNVPLSCRMKLLSAGNTKIRHARYSALTLHGHLAQAAHGGFVGSSSALLRAGARVSLGNCSCIQAGSQSERGGGLMQLITAVSSQIVNGVESFSL